MLCPIAMPLKRLALIKALKKIIWAYSAKKNKANGIPGYSTLNPETNSDSPSARSKGALFVSAIQETISIKPTGRNGRKNQVLNSCSVEMLIILNDSDGKIKHINRTPKETSYDIIWAPALRAPRKANLELLPQPDIITP